MSSNYSVHLEHDTDVYPVMTIEDYPDNGVSRFTTINFDINQHSQSASGRERLTIFFKDQDRLVNTLRSMRDTINTYLDEEHPHQGLPGMGAHEVAIMGVINDILTPNTSKTV